MEPGERVTELSKAMRKFFANLLSINYEFTFDELRQELKKHNIDGKYESGIEEFFKRLDEFQYGGSNPTGKDVEELTSGAKFIVRHMTGYSAEQEQQEEKRESVSDRLIGGIRKLAGMGAEPSRKPSAQEAVLDEISSRKPSDEQRPLSITVERINRNLESLRGRPVSLKGSLKYVNRIIGTNDFWYMFSDNTGQMVALSNISQRLKGNGNLTGIVKKTLTGEGFIEIRDFR